MLVQKVDKIYLADLEGLDGRYPGNVVISIVYTTVRVYVGAGRNE